ncbi:MAG: glucosaminidase domain-containing protein [Elusimicrobia bacterium]|nr:glucosaminidase domain-containing protein [Elusimicrobiota bacterium]
MIQVIMAAALLLFAAVLSGAEAGPVDPAKPAAPTGAGFRGFITEVFARVGTEGMNPEELATMAVLETASGTGKAFKATNNPGSIHKHGWTGPTYTTTFGEVLRKYSTIEDGARDMVKFLLVNPRYSKAVAASRGRTGRFFAEVAAAGWATSLTYAADLQREHDTRNGTRTA